DQGERSMGALYIVAGVVFLLVAIAAAWFLFMGKASAAESPPLSSAKASPVGPAGPAGSIGPAQMIPASFDALLAVDVPALQRAAPPQSLTPLFDAIRPQLAEIGATPESIGQLAVGVTG